MTKDDKLEQNIHQIFNPDTGYWQSVTNLEAPRCFHAIATRVLTPSGEVEYYTYEENTNMNAGFALGVELVRLTELQTTVLLDKIRQKKYVSH